MPKSIRDTLGRRARALVLLAMGGWLVFIACIFAPAIPLPIMVSAFVAVVGSLLGLLLSLRCPHCRARIPQVGLAEVWAPPSAVKPRHCPNCGADLCLPIA